MGSRESLDVESWKQLVATMLPKPLVDSPSGMVGGDPGEVVALVDANAIHIAAYRAELRGQQIVLAIKKWKVFELDAEPERVAAVVQKARARRVRTYRWCSHCHSVVPPERMVDAHQCDECAARVEDLD